MIFEKLFEMTHSLKEKWILWVLNVFDIFESSLAKIILIKVLNEDAPNSFSDWLTRSDLGRNWADFSLVYFKTSLSKGTIFKVPLVVINDSIPFKAEPINIWTIRSIKFIKSSHFWSMVPWTKTQAPHTNQSCGISLTLEKLCYTIGRLVQYESWK